MDTDRIKGMAQDVGGAVQKKLGDIADDPKGHAESVARQAQDLYGQAKDSLQDASDSVVDYAGPAYQQIDKYASRGTKVARQEIGEHPLTSIVLAGVIGYLLAMFLHGRR